MIPLIISSKNWLYVQLTILLLIVLLSTLRWIIWGDAKHLINARLDKVRRSSFLYRASLIRRYNNYLRHESFEARKNFYINEQNGFLTILPPKLSFKESLDGSDNTDSSSFIRYNMSYNIMQCILGYAFSYLFPGYLAAIIPFFLPYQFKSLLQIGMNVSYLTTSYISALPWHLINLMTSWKFIDIYKYLLQRPVILNKTTTIKDYSDHLGVEIDNEYVSFGAIFSQVINQTSQLFMEEKEKLENTMHQNIFGHVEIMALSLLEH
ncbi:hypothetical protein BEWA_019720 [Theileria equi strain WA]|uniref:ER membrane protein complex subunit 3 n=1 Tax=Theileria equi strain WA TaxID=1537102 RepID=L0AVS2_THEEQ|nr:hypothetical protein BEWA_019720 [Theileria equi strain WA]AFZ79126.1 hypothetical protein BEWA_019720 [Theileria equi strain WA]|eukprot:XP_004828792.1 hypothetical protein BEWA_019720 [Theileria equi strain WA]